MEPIRRLAETRDHNAVVGDLVVISVLVNEDPSGFRVVMMGLGLLSLVALLLTAVGLCGCLRIT